MRGILRLRKRGVFLPEEVALSMNGLNGQGNVTGGLVDSVAVPRSVFGRLAEMCAALADEGVYLEKAIPTALSFVSLPQERLREQSHYVWGGVPPKGVAVNDFLASTWTPTLGWFVYECLHALPLQNCLICGVSVRALVQVSPMEAPRREHGKVRCAFASPLFY
jgi:hypothetical protein